jgi:hypothetical protein
MPPAPAQPAFDSESAGYDYKTAVAAGMGPAASEENEGHWGSVTMASEEVKKKYNLPDETYVVLKGKAHETWDLAVQGEAERGFEIKKYGNRYYSVPKGTK